MKSSIHIASPSNLNDIVCLINRAFRADPTVSWVLPTPHDFEVLHSKLVRIWAEAVIDLGTIHYHRDFSGAAIWYPPGTEYDDAAFSKVIRSGSRQDRVNSFFELVEACSNFRPVEPYWELEFLAVDPAWQGQGIGSRLLEHGLQHCVDKAAPVYLESSNPANLTIYRRFGFEVLAEVQFSGTPKRFPMLRRVR